MPRFGRISDDVMGSWPLARLNMLEDRELTRLVVLACITTLVIAEMASALLSLDVSLACYAGLLLTLLNLPLLLPSLTGEGRTAVVTLGLIPAVKIAAMALPIRAVPEAYWEAFPAVVALVTVIAMRQVVNRPVGILDIRRSRPRGGWTVQLAIAVGGLVIAWLAAAFLSVLDPATAEPGATATPASVLTVAALSGVSLEIVFRGAIQQSLVGIFGQLGGIGLASVLYASMFAASNSLFLVGLALLTGLAWGTAAAATRALTGVAASHALFSMAWAGQF
jgi:membrane protease YdiL (CAAX protease family)